MKAMLVLTFIMANGTFVEQEPIKVRSFQLCLDMMTFAIKRPITQHLTSQGVVEIMGECRYAVDVPDYL